MENEDTHVTVLLDNYENNYKGKMAFELTIYSKKENKEVSSHNNFRSKSDI